MNHLDTPKHRKQFASETLSEFIKNVGRTNYLLTIATAGDYPLGDIFFNSSFSTISSTVLWLREHGAVIPAEVLAELEIEA